MRSNILGFHGVSWPEDPIFFSWSFLRVIFWKKGPGEGEVEGEEGEGEGGGEGEHFDADPSRRKQGVGEK